MSLFVTLVSDSRDKSTMFGGIVVDVCRSGVFRMPFIIFGEYFLVLSDKKSQKFHKVLCESLKRRLNTAV